eukprot:gene48952-65635_t
MPSRPAFRSFRRDVARWANINLVPSWLLHLFRPYGGTAERISIASISASRTTKSRMRVMGIETSCDETAVAVIEAPAGTQAVGRILSNTVYSQLAEHRRFGGVVPEIAARAHLERIDGLVAQALDEA